MNKKKGRNVQKKIFYLLIILVILFGALNIMKARGLFIPEQPLLYFTNRVIDLDSLTLEQKIAQMVIVVGAKENYWYVEEYAIGRNPFIRQAERTYL